jgi:hypothetical protein
MNVLKALAWIICMCNLHVILLSNIVPRYFTLFTVRIFRPFNVRESGGFFQRHSKESRYYIYIYIGCYKSSHIYIYNFIY